MESLMGSTNKWDQTPFILQAEPEKENGVVGSPCWGPTSGSPGSGLALCGKRQDLSPMLHAPN